MHMLGIILTYLPRQRILDYSEKKKDVDDDSVIVILLYKQENIK